MFTEYDVFPSYPAFGIPENVGVIPPLLPWHPQPFVEDPVTPLLYPKVVSEIDRTSNITKIAVMRFLLFIRLFVQLLVIVSIGVVCLFAH